MRKFVVMRILNVTIEAPSLKEALLRLDLTSDYDLLVLPGAEFLPATIHDPETGDMLADLGAA